MHPIKEIIDKRQKGQNAGIWSVCSANRYVIAAAMQRCKKNNLPLLVEATANQVNQNGGYTGMNPLDFKNFIFNIAKENGFDAKDIILGGDHLGPLTWCSLNSDEAMQNADVLVNAYVSAGYTKIHIDTSMKLGDDDKTQMLSPNTVAKRGARLAKICEEAFANLQKQNPNALHPVYVIGSEVPVPGGSKETEEMCVTKPTDFENTFNIFKDEFTKLGVDQSNIIAVVVQPGVEFSNEDVQYYNRENAKELCEAKQKYPDIVFEGHSSDYQTKFNLRDMVQDGIAILKVGPALTFAMREGLFALSNIENELNIKQDEKACFIETLEKAMLDNPKYWQGYYVGSNEQMHFERKYGLSDRCRYYFAEPVVEKAIEKLIQNLDKRKLPLALISQYLPQQYRAVIEGEISNNAKALLLDKIGTLMDDYIFAVQASAEPCY